MDGLKIYRNEDVRRIIAFIPPGHRHIRILIEFNDQRIVLQEATIAAIVRAYIDIATHPSRKAVEMISRKMDTNERKPSYAEHQLVETNRSEEDILKEVAEILGYQQQS